MLPSATPRDSPRAIAAWCLYDWGNSAFTTLVVTFIYSTYFTQAIAADELTGTAQWAQAVGLSAVVIALLSPFLGVAADTTGSRKRYLAVVTAISVVATAALAFVRPDTPHAVLWSLGAFVIANVGFELGIVFYNSFLPIIASPKRLGRISGLGWGVGYLGGLVCMMVALFGFIQPEQPWFGMTRADGFNIRATNLLVALWFLFSSLPLFVFVHEPRGTGARFSLRATFRELMGTLRAIRRFREVLKFLIAHLIYNDGLVTVWAFGSIYASGTFDMPLEEVMVFGIVLNVVSGLGAFAFGFVDDRIGGKRTIMVTLVALSAATIIAALAPTKAWFWTAGILIGIFGGPNQAASRSLMARFVPPRHSTEFFGLFALSGKVTSFVGPILLGSVALAFGSQRAGVATVVIFLVLGAVVLATVDEQAGIRTAETK